MKYFRVYFPIWKKKVKENRLIWETSFEVKNAAASTSKSPANLILNDLDDGKKKEPVAEL